MLLSRAASVLLRPRGHILVARQTHHRHTHFGGINVRSYQAGYPEATRQLYAVIKVFLGAGLMCGVVSLERGCHGKDHRSCCTVCLLIDCLQVGLWVEVIVQLFHIKTSHYYYQLVDLLILQHSDLGACMGLP